MNTPTIPPCPPSHDPHRVVPPRVYAEGEARHDLLVDLWRVEPGPEFGLVRLVHADALAGQWSELPPINSRVRVESGTGLFEGVVTRHIGELSAESDRATAEVRDVLWHWLGQTVVGHWRTSEGAAVWCADGPGAFNSAGWPASVAEITLAGKPTRVFGEMPVARKWSVGDILAYLLAAYLPPQVEAPAWEELARLAEGFYPDPVDIAGLPLREALSRVANLAGLAMRSAVGPSGPMLVFYRPGVDGRRRQVFLAPPGEAAWAGSNVLSADIRLSARLGRPGVTAFGARKRYEVTVELGPGWDPSLQTTRYRDFVPSQSPNWPALAEVFRKWVLNESGRYSGEPWNLWPFDCATLAPEDFFLQAPRRLRPCVSTDPLGAGRGIVVEVSTDSGETWGRYAGAVLASQDECSIYLADDALDGEFFQAAVEGRAAVRVTATLSADRRLTVEFDGDPDRPRRIIRLRSAWFERVHPSSIFYEPGLGTGVGHDDTAVLSAWAQRVQAGAKGGCDATVTLALADASFQAGDLVEALDGRDIDFRCSSTFAPHVDRIVHRFGDEWTTELHILG